MLASASGVAVVVLALAAAAACTNLDDLSEPDCAYSVSPTSIDVGSQGGDGTLTVRTPGVCAWTVDTPADWVRFSGTRSGKGNASVAYAIEAHEGFDVRSATISVGGQSVRVSQAGRPIPIIVVCSYAVTPTAWTYPWEGGQGSIAVAAQPGCAWTAVSQAAWMTITIGGRGSGTGTFGFNVAVNPMQVSRTGTLSVGGQTITITQARNNTGTNGKR